MPTERIKVQVELPIKVEYERDQDNMEFRASDPIGHWYHGNAGRTPNGWSVRLWIDNNPIPQAIRTVDRHRTDDTAKETERLLTTWVKALEQAIKLQARTPAPTVGASRRR